MSDNPQVTAKIDITGDLRVGASPQPPNRFKLVITNNGDAVSGQLTFYFTGTLGSSETALFLNQDDARYCTKTVPNDWNADWSFPDENTFRVEIYTFNDPVLAPSQQVTIEFSQVVSKTAPGKASLGFGSDLAALQDLSINKTAAKAGIIAFYSDPPAGVQNLPGANVTLKWRTFDLIDRKLEEVGGDELPADFTEDEGLYRYPDLSADTTFMLSGVGAGPPRVEQKLTLRVLKSGWYDRKNVLVEGDPGYPRPTTKSEASALKSEYKTLELEPLELLNANDQQLYGVFRYWFQKTEVALLFQTQNLFGRWKLVRCSVPDQDGMIPEGFAASPAIYFDDRIWLIGGSQIDPDNTSNIVWRLNLASDPPGWENLGAATWQARMGHGLTVLKNRIWLMGGRNKSGNALNDVWSCDKDGKWNCETKAAAWTPRCLFRPAVLNEEIWLYGGMKEPFAGQSLLYNELYRYSSGVWKKEDRVPVNDRNPLASCLVVFRNTLRLFGKFRFINPIDRSELVDPLAFSLSNPSTGAWESLPVEGLKDWGGVNTFNVQVLSFKDQMLVAKALAYDRPNVVMKVFVPSS